MGNLPHTLVGSVVWGSEETPLLMFSWFLPERNSTSRRFLLWRFTSRLFPSLLSVCKRKTDSVLVWKNEGDVNVSNRHLQRCMWRNSWKTLPKLATFRLKKRSQFTICRRLRSAPHRNHPWAASLGHRPAIPHGEHRIPCSTSLGSLPGSRELILLPKKYPALFFGYLPYLERCGFPPLAFLLCQRSVSSWLPHRGMQLSCPDSLCQFQHEGNPSQPYNLH